MSNTNIKKMASINIHLTDSGNYANIVINETRKCEFEFEVLEIISTIYYKFTISKTVSIYASIINGKIKLFKVIYGECQYKNNIYFRSGDEYVPIFKGEYKKYEVKEKLISMLKSNSLVNDIFKSNLYISVFMDSI